MATLVLQAAGAAIGGLFGAVGATIGTAVGALAGNAIDHALFGSSRHTHGPRLAGQRPLAGEEGAPIPRLYGTARLGATVIWATRFEEVSRTERQGGKGGGPKQTNYSYFANVALALCEGEIACIRRVWADGREVDLGQLDLRLYRGSEDQQPDPLIEAKQGAGNAPAYRGTAYAVIERMALDGYGNRVPQFQFEVIRPVGNLNPAIRAVTLVPGSTEFGLSPVQVTRIAGGYWNLPGELGAGHVALNRAVAFAASDLAASVDELQALCPNLEHVALVTTWFGDDLRAGRCRIAPRVVHRGAPAASIPWRVSGTGPATAEEVSRHDGAPAYGGTPADLTLMQAIRELRNRNLKVTLYPFVMMDIPADNALPDPHGNGVQPAYPWRGRITCDPAPGQANSADRTASAREQAAAFCGSALPGDFSPAADTVIFSGRSDDWGYRRMILHHARLAAAAGGVDAFLVGSELVGLTSLRDENGGYPFVEALVRLAGEVRQILGDETTVTYGADWSEYFGHRPDDGSGDVTFHLDPLWSSPDIGAVGIDNYMPLGDWRDGDHGGGNPDGATGPNDVAALAAAVAGGEGYDWFYASHADRQTRTRTPIRDGARGKPWVFRYKDLVGWWSNAHHDRRGGVEVAQPTAWVPCGKPIWFTELGCAAIDKGANQPNCFPDPKSAEHAVPHFSSGGRDDAAQRAFLEAHLSHWDPAAPGFREASNPVSPVYGGRMVDPRRIYLWCWDARPFPAFPLEAEQWSDGGNWLHGHWLNGRISGVGLGDLIDAILADHGLPSADMSGISACVSGYVIDSPGSARAAIEPLADLFGLAGRETGGRLVLFQENAMARAPVAIGERVVPADEPALASVRMPAQALPGQIELQFHDPMLAYQVVSVRHAAVSAAASAGQHRIALPICLETSRGEVLAADWLRRQHAGRDRLTFHLPADARHIEPGSIVEHPADPAIPLLVTAVEDGLARRVEARRIAPAVPTPEAARLPASPASEREPAGPPLALFLDLPIHAAGEAQDQFRIAGWCAPWRNLVISASAGDAGFAMRATLQAPATIAMLDRPLAPGPAGRIDRANALWLRLISGELASTSDIGLLNGANVLALRTTGDGLEIVQFRDAEEVEPSLWRLSGLLRGQLGTEDAMQGGAAAGDYAVLLDDRVVPAGLERGEIGLARNWRVQPSGLASMKATMAETTEIGGLRALCPLAPVHVRARPAGDGGIDVTWIRRSRIDADSWLGADIPLGEDEEAYRLRIRASDGTVLREAVTHKPEWHYEPAGRDADARAGASLRIEICQISAAIGDGAVATLDLNL